MGSAPVSHFPHPRQPISMTQTGTWLIGVPIREIVQPTVRSGCECHILRLTFRRFATRSICSESRRKSRWGNLVTMLPSETRENVTAIRAYETAYCWATVAMALGLPLSMLLPLHWFAYLSQFLAVGLATLFPIGLVIALTRPRWCVPRIVVLCVVVSGIWIGVLLKYNSHQWFRGSKETHRSGLLDQRLLPRGLLLVGYGEGRPNATSVRLKADGAVTVLNSIPTAQ